MNNGVKSFLGLIFIVLLMVVGLPTRVINTRISDETYDDIKGVQQILSSTKKEISLDSLAGVFSPLAPDEYGYIDSEEKVDKLFSFLPDDKRNEVKNVLKSGQVKNIDIMRPRCIRFTLATSFNNFFLTRSWETLDLIFNDSCVCNCQDQRMDEETISKEDLGKGWFKVSIITRRTRPHA